MIQVIELNGREKRLYQLVAPLVMDPEVLKQNYNYPFRTADNYTWFIAIEGKDVVGFIPVESKRSELIINNYYIKDDNLSVLKILLEQIINSSDTDKRLTSVTFIEHKKMFIDMGFSEEKLWKRYVKMKKD